MYLEEENYWEDWKGVLRKSSASNDILHLKSHADSLDNIRRSRIVSRGSGHSCCEIEASNVCVPLVVVDPFVEIELPIFLVRNLSESLKTWIKNQVFLPARH